MDGLVNIEVYTASGNMINTFYEATNLQQSSKYKITFTYRGKQIAVSYPAGVIIVTKV